MVQTRVTLRWPGSVGNGLRAVPRIPERHGVRSLQNFATRYPAGPQLEPCLDSPHGRFLSTIPSRGANALPQLPGVAPTPACAGRRAGTCRGDQNASFRVLCAMAGVAVIPNPVFLPHPSAFIPHPPFLLPSCIQQKNIGLSRCGPNSPPPPVIFPAFFLENRGENRIQRLFRPGKVMDRPCLAAHHAQQWSRERAGTMSGTMYS